MLKAMAVMAVIAAMAASGPSYAGRTFTSERANQPTSFKDTSSQPCLKYGHGPCDQRDSSYCHPTSNAYDTTSKSTPPACKEL